MEIAVPAQVWAGDPVLAELTATVPATSVVILNPGNGGAPFGSSWCARADARRAGTTVTGERPKVLGCLHTDHGHGLRTPDGRLPVDGVFFDVVSRDCGPGHVIRDQPGPRRPRRPAIAFARRRLRLRDQRGDAQPQGLRPHMGLPPRNGPRRHPRAEPAAPLHASRLPRLERSYI
ncbi:hypothetical protein [Streptomyces sp. NPDC127112]|uniref:hypothetical protein n=1 Tax=Streptomyces sp. NPDC127112 TaxID=3345364 RepID=UPI0036411BF1